MTTGRCPTCNHTLDLNQGGFLPPHSVLRTVRGTVTITEVWKGFSRHDRPGTVTHCPGSGKRPS